MNNIELISKINKIKYFEKMFPFEMIELNEFEMENSNLDMKKGKFKHKINLNINLNSDCNIDFSKIDFQNTRICFDFLGMKNFAVRLLFDGRSFSIFSNDKNNLKIDDIKMIKLFFKTGDFLILKKNKDFRFEILKTETDEDWFFTKINFILDF